MAKDTQINVRFPSEIDRELTSTAIALGVTKSSLVRRLTELFLQEVSRTGAVSLNPQWIKDLSKADARSSWGQAKTEGGRPKKGPQEGPP